MTPQQIKRAKRLAEILGLTVYDNCDGPTQDDCFLDFYDPRGDMGPKVFNPEQDKALLWDLRLEYNVEISPWEDNTMVVFIENPKTCERLVTIDDVTKDQLPAALIDCVIEINGGYDV